jgi:hypothetical protein
MIAADTSTWISFLEGDAGEAIEMLAKALGGDTSADDRDEALA